MKKILLIMLLVFSALLFVGCVNKKDDEIIAHILEVEESKTFDSYDELDNFLSVGLDTIDGGDYYHKYVNKVKQGNASYLIPLYENKISELTSFGSWKILLITTELYRRPWIFYSISIDDINMQVRVMLDELDIEETNTLKLVKTLSTNFDSSNYKDSFEKDILVNNNNTSTFVIISNDGKTHIYFRYNNYLISVFTNDEEDGSKIINSDILSKLSFERVDVKPTEINDKWLGKTIYEKEGIKSKVDASYFEITNNTLIIDPMHRYRIEKIDKDNDFYTLEIEYPKDAIVYSAKDEWDNECFYLIIDKNNYFSICDMYFNKEVKYVERIYNLTKISELVTSLPEEKPDDFSFELSFGFDGYYNSKTGVLKNGYNYDLDKECVTELFLTSEELSIIYKMLRKIMIDNIPKYLMVSNEFVEPSYDPFIKIEYNNYCKHVQFSNGSYIKVDEWFYYKEFGEVYYTIVNEYIKSSEEFQSLPPNQNLYD